MKRIAMLLTILFLLVLAAPSFAQDSNQQRRRNRQRQHMKYKPSPSHDHMIHSESGGPKTSEYYRKNNVKPRNRSRNYSTSGTSATSGDTHDVVENETKWERRQRKVREFNARMKKEKEEYERQQRIYEEQKQEVERRNEEIRQRNEEIKQYNDDQARQRAHEINEQYRLDQQYRQRTGGASRDSGVDSNWKPYSGQVDPNRPYSYDEN